MWWHRTGLEKQKLRSIFSLSHSSTGLNSLSLKGNTVQDEFSASSRVSVLTKDKYAKIYFQSRNSEKMQLWQKQHKLFMC